jgi:hypothetical protein
MKTVVTCPWRSPRWLDSLVHFTISRGSSYRDDRPGREINASDHRGPAPSGWTRPSAGRQSPQAIGLLGGIDTSRVRPRVQEDSRQTNGERASRPLDADQPSCCGPAPTPGSRFLPASGSNHAVAERVNLRSGTMTRVRPICQALHQAVHASTSSTAFPLAARTARRVPSSMSAKSVLDTVQAVEHADVHLVCPRPENPGCAWLAVVSDTVAGNPRP